MAADVGHSVTLKLDLKFPLRGIVFPFQVLPLLFDTGWIAQYT